jgi:hypothetical protein
MDSIKTLEMTAQSLEESKLTNATLSTCRTRTCSVIACGALNKAYHRISI